MKTYKEFINESKVFVLKDLTGHGDSCRYTLDELPKIDKNFSDDIELGEFDKTITEWGTDAEPGEEYIQRTFKVICIK